MAGIRHVNVTTLLIADDHALMRAGLKLTLQLDFGPAAVYEAADGLQAVEAAVRERPDLAILDIGMPRLNGLEAAGRIAEAVPSCRIIILSMHADEQSVGEAFRNGATGYVLKNAPVGELSTAVGTVMRGQQYLSTGLSSFAQAAAGGGDASPLSALTSRQREVLQLIAEGESTKEIAFRLNLSGKTVETHRRQIMERLQIYDVARLVRFALRAGLIQPE